MRNSDIRALVVFGPLLFIYNSSLIGWSAALVGIPMLALASMPLHRAARVPIPAPLTLFLVWAGFVTVLYGFRGGATYLLPVLVGAALSGLVASQGDPARLRSVLAAAITAAVVVSLVVEALAPRVLVEASQVDGWTGLFDHKNSFGSVAGLGLLLTFSPAQGWKRAQLGAAVVNATALVGSRSISALLAVLLAYCWWQLGERLPRGAGARVLGRTAVAVTGILAVTKFGATWAAMIGKDPTFTGRTTIWSVAWDAYERSPITGYGVGGFWQAATSADAVSVTQRKLHFTPGISHNAVLDVLLEVGIVGAVLLAVCIATAFRRLHRARRQELKWLSLLLTYLIVLSATERGVYSAVGFFVVALALSVRIRPTTVGNGGEYLTAIDHGNEYAVLSRTPPVPLRRAHPSVWDAH